MISYFSDLPCLVYKFGMQQVDLFDVITWSLWNRRNKNRLNEACVLLNRVFDSAKSYLKSFSIIESLQWRNSALEYLFGTHLTMRATKPIMMVLSVYTNTNEVGLRVVICDSQGEVLISFSIRKNHHSIECDDSWNFTY